MYRPDLVWVFRRLDSVYISRGSFQSGLAPHQNKCARHLTDHFFLSFFLQIEHEAFLFAHIFRVHISRVLIAEKCKNIKISNFFRTYLKTVDLVIELIKVF